MKRKFLRLVLLTLMLSLFGAGCSAAPDGTAEQTNETETTASTTAAPIVETTAVTTAETEPPTPPEPPKPMPVSGDWINPTKISSNVEERSVTVTQKSNKDAPYFSFYNNDVPLSGKQWAVTGTIQVLTDDSHSGHILFIASKDDNNIAKIFINRRIGGVNGIYQSLADGGVRTPTSGQRKVSDTLIEGTDWSAEFVFMYFDGRVSLYLKEKNEEYQLMTSYDISWECTADFTVAQYADVNLTNVQTFTDTADIQKVQNIINNVPENPIDSKKLLFIGNSATYVYDIPQLLSRLARKAGYNVQADSVTLSGGKLSQHADASTEHGKNVLKAIDKGYDIVILQEVTACIASEESRAESLTASTTLDKAIRASKAKTYFYVRPPTGKDTAGYKSYEQCVELDKLFGKIAGELDAQNVYVNRAFAYAIKNSDIGLWGDDNAHVNENGAYLIACVFFSSLFNKSASVLDYDTLPESTAKALQKIADKVVLENYIPQ